MKVFICLDHSQYTSKVLQAAKVLLSTRAAAADITILHVIDTGLVPDSAINQEQIMMQLRQESEDIRTEAAVHLGNTITYIEEYGIPHLKIEQLQTEIPHDLLVIGSRGRSLAKGVLFGSIAQQVVQQSRMPVLLIP